MLPFLSKYPDREAAKLLASGFQDGFKNPCSLAMVLPKARNLTSALQHPGVVEDKLGREVAMGRMGGALCQQTLAGFGGVTIGGGAQEGTEQVPRDTPLIFSKSHVRGFQLVFGVGD